MFADWSWVSAIMSALGMADGILPSLSCVSSSTVCPCLLSSGGSPFYSQWWLRRSCLSKITHNKRSTICVGHLLVLLLCETPNGSCSFMRSFYLQTQAHQIWFNCFTIVIVSDLWQKEVLHTSQADSVYNDLWGVYSCEVSFAGSRCFIFCQPSITFTTKSYSVLMYVLT